MLNSCNCRVVRAFTSGAVDSGLIPSPDSESGQTNDLVFTASVLDALHSNGTAWRTSHKVYLCRWERHLTGFSHIKMVGRWPATPEGACYCALIAFL